MSEWTYAQAIRQALADAMAEDPNVFVLGEDVAHGGPFGVTRGLVEQFGPERVRNTPISEAAMAGFAVGAALVGLRPVAEIMFMDFITLALDALVNQAAKLPFLSADRQRVPAVVRVQAGAWHSAGAQHSQSLEAWLAHVPGLTVVAPASALDAYRDLRWALSQDGPVVLMEHKALYGRREPKPARLAAAPPRPQVVREGSDVSLITYSAMVGQALEAANRLAQRNIAVEVVDLHCLAPLDLSVALTSLRKTHRAVVAHEAVLTGGLGAEVAASLGAVGFDELDAPIVRVGAPSLPVPFSPPLEAAVIPDAERLVAAVAAVMR